MQKFWTEEGVDVEPGTADAVKEIICEYAKSIGALTKANTLMRHCGPEGYYVEGTRKWGVYVMSTDAYNAGGMLNLWYSLAGRMGTGESDRAIFRSDGQKLTEKNIAFAALQVFHWHKQADDILEIYIGMFAKRLAEAITDNGPDGSINRVVNAAIILDIAFRLEGM